jgi:hypothetical protein
MNSNTRNAERVREARANAHRPDDGAAFLPDATDATSTGQHNPLGGTDGESFAEEFIASATGGEPVEMDAQDEVVEEEWGGPFLELEAEEGDASEVIPEPPGLHKLPPRLQ